MPAKKYFTIEEQKEAKRIKAKKYHDKNKTEIYQKKREKYYEDIEKTREAKRKSYQRNKDKISIERKETIACIPCKKFIKKGSISRHSQSERHLKNIEKPVERNFSCKLCDKFFLTENNLTVHNKTAVHLLNEKHERELEEVNDVVKKLKALKVENTSENL